MIHNWSYTFSLLVEKEIEPSWMLHVCSATVLASSKAINNIWFLLLPKEYNENSVPSTNDPFALFF